MMLALIVYASLYPFSGWRITATPVLAFLVAPAPRWWTWFDVVSNLLGYMPFGLLVFGAFLRTGRTQAVALSASFAAGTCLSLLMEVLQNFLPLRIPSNIDLLLNALGSLLGALVGVAVHRAGGVGRWQQIRDRWFIDKSAGGIALLLSWPAGLLFPPPVPLGQGQIFGALQQLALTLVDGTAIESWWQGWTDAYGLSTSDPLSPASEWSITALGLLVPCLVAYTIARPGWRRICLAAGAALLGFLVTTLSTALNFGPDHALAWRTAPALPGFVGGIVIALLLCPVNSRVAAGLGLIAITVLCALVAQAPSDPYYAESLQAWEQGRFVRFHGLAQWVGWLWPYAALLWLLARIGARA